MLAHIGRNAAAVLVTIAATTVATSTVFAAKGAVSETTPGCQLATAVLLVGNDGDAAGSWQKIESFIEAKRVWKVGQAKPGVAGEIEYVQFDVVNPKQTGPTKAFTVRCGSGGTCNEIANGFAAAYADLTPAPVVLCGEVNGVLSNPSAK